MAMEEWKKKVQAILRREGARKKLVSCQLW